MGNVYEIRAQKLDRKKDGEVISQLTEKGINLIVFFRGEYFHLFYLKGAFPKASPEEYHEFDTLLRIEEGANMKSKVVDNLGSISSEPPKVPAAETTKSMSTPQTPADKEEEHRGPYVDPLEDWAKEK